MLLISMEKKGLMFNILIIIFHSSQIEKLSLNITINNWIE